MDSARDRTTKELVEAEELWLLDRVDKENYVCSGCDIQVFPAAYAPGRKVRPYFTPRKDNPHDAGCEENEISTILTRAREGPVLEPTGEFPISFPDRLELPESESDERTAGSGTFRNSPASVGHSHSPPSRRSCWSAKSIRALCKTFVRFPFDRDRLQLRIPGLAGTTYGSVFSYLNKGGVKRHDRGAIFYAEIRWTAPVTSDDASLIVTLSAGDWEERRLVRPYRATIRWHTWSVRQRGAFLREIETGKEEAAAEARRESDRRKAKKAWLFLLGRQRAGDDSIFETNDRKLVCCLVENITYPQRS